MDKVTILIPNYNEKKELLRKSVLSAVNQTWKNMEVIVVDDGSTAYDVEEVLSDVLDKIILVKRPTKTNPLRTVSEAVNEGLKYFTGDWFVMNSADNYFQKTFAEELVKKANAVGARAVCCDWLIHNLDGTVEVIQLNQHYKTDDMLVNFIARCGLCSNYLIRRDLMEEAGLYWDTRFPRGQTSEWLIRVIKKERVWAYVPKILFTFVYHEKDQLKSFASVKYKTLRYLLHDIDITHLFRQYQDSPKHILAILAGVDHFLHSKEFEKDKEKSMFWKWFNKIDDISTSEASESV